MVDRQNVKSDDDRAADAHERGRDYLGPAQIDWLLAAASKGRHGIRDHLLVLMMFRHGLRVSEAIALRRADADLAQSRLWVARLKNGLSVEHPVAGDELRALRRWLAARDDALPWLFVSERRQPLTRQAVNYIIGAAAKRAGLGSVHPGPLHCLEWRRRGREFPPSSSRFRIDEQISGEGDLIRDTGLASCKGL